MEDFVQKSALSLLPDSYLEEKLLTPASFWVINLTSLPRNAQKQQFPALFSTLTCKCLLVGSSYSERPSHNVWPNQPRRQRKRVQPPPPKKKLKQFISMQNLQPKGFRLPAAVPTHGHPKYYLSIYYFQIKVAVYCQLTGCET